MADEMLRRLKFENQVRRQVVTLVKYHDIDLPEDPRVVRRWLSRLGRETFFQLLEVKRADALAQDRDKSQKHLERCEGLRALAETLAAEGQCLSLKELAVNGKDALALGFSPGPEVGKVLTALLERVLDGALPNERETLLKTLKEYEKQN